jgi:hypothetical protein
MNAPASTLRMNRVNESAATRFTPVSSARSAIADGKIASNVTS